MLMSSEQNDEEIPRLRTSLMPPWTRSKRV